MEDPEIAITIDEYSLQASCWGTCWITRLIFPWRGRIIVRVFRETDGTVCVNVEDTGVGIDSSYIQGCSSHSRKRTPAQARRYEGMGFGLALAKRYLSR